METQPQAAESIIPQFIQTRVSSLTDTTKKWAENSCGWWTILLLIIGCTSTGFAFVIPGIDDPILRLSLLFSSLALEFLSLFFLLILYHVDPGVVPSLPNKDTLVALADLGTVPPNLVKNEKGQWIRRAYADIEGAHGLVERYCDTCNIWRQPRTSHCNKCGFCMERFDHHCTALGTCIAKKNYRFFIAFLFSISMTSGILLTSTIWRFKQEAWGTAPDFWNTWKMYLLGILGFAYIYASALFIFALMHCTALLLDCTTKQYLKSQTNSNERSFQSWIDNLRGVCCSEVNLKWSIEAKKENDVV